MRIAHVGPLLSRSGGPAGYMLQLRDALAQVPHSHGITFPADAPPGAPGRRPQSLAVRVAKRLRRIVTGRRFYRPSPAACMKKDGPVGRMMADGFRATNAAAEPSLSRAVADRSDVLFAHDVSVAEAALHQRHSGQQVWLMLHSPMPLALYTAWNWGVPEADWRDVVTYPDVQAWTAREIDICRRVDRVVVPCVEACEELVRCAPAYASVLRNAEIVMTGASRRASPAPRPADARERALLRAKWRLPLDQRVGLFLGTAQAYRGYDALLAGLDRLADSVAIPGIVAVAGPDPATVPHHDRTRLLGRVDDVDALLRAVDFVVNVNRFSLFDLSVIEALEAGRPLVMHHTGGNKTFRALGAGCIVLENLDPPTVARGLETAFTLPEADMSALGRQSRACYEGALTPAHMAARHMALYAVAPERVPRVARA